MLLMKNLTCSFKLEYNLITNNYTFQTYVVSILQICKHAKLSLAKGVSTIK